MKYGKIFDCRNRDEAKVEGRYAFCDVLQNIVEMKEGMYFDGHLKSIRDDPYPFQSEHGHNWQFIREIIGETKYRPYKDTDEMIADWKERNKGNWAETSMPLIWVKGKNGEKHLLTDYSDWSVESSYDKISMTALFKDYTYLNGSPCGKEVIE